MDYKKIHWESIAFIRQYLAHRLLDLDLAQQTNILRAWSSLIQWKNGQKMDSYSRQAINLTKLPGWFNEFLSRHAIIKNETLRSVLAYPDTFYEGICLLVSLAESIGELSHIMLSEAAAPLEGVWIRVVFTPTSGKPYENRQEVLQRLDPNDPKTRIIATEFHAAEDFFEMNHSRLGLQHNTRTGHQSFAVMLPLAEALTEKSKVETPKTREIEKPLEPIYQLLIGEKANLALPTETPNREKIEKAEDALAVIYQLLEDKTAENRVEQIRAVLKNDTLNLDELRQMMTQTDTQPTRAVSLLVKIYDTLLKEPTVAAPKIEVAVVQTATPHPLATPTPTPSVAVEAKSEAVTIPSSVEVEPVVATTSSNGEQQLQESTADTNATREKDTNGNSPKEA